SCSLASWFMRWGYPLVRESASRAAFCPERTAPSSVAGKPVSVQSPASSKLDHLVMAPGLGAACCDRDAIGEGEDPLSRSADHARHQRRSGGRRNAKMRVDDG